MNAPIFRLFALFALHVRRADRLQLALGRVRRPAAAREPAEQPRRARGAADQARRDPRRRRHGAGRQHRAHAATATRAATRRARCSPSRSASTTSSSGAPGLEKQYNDALVGRKEELGRLIDSIVSKDTRRRQPADDARPEGAEGRVRGAPGPQGRGRGARRQDRRRARAGRDAVLRPDGPGQEGHDDLQQRHPGPLSARLDVQDRDRDRGDRLRQATSPTRRSAARTGR